MKTQPATHAAAVARAQAVEKVRRRAATWRQMYEVDALGVALHRAILENA